jgi:hypothetical protein
MKIPVFVSCPTALNAEQNDVRELVCEQLEAYLLEPRAVGRSDYPIDSPLREVAVLAKHCSGAVILGFEQMFAEKVVVKRGTPGEKERRDVSMPTEWNHLEAGIMFGLGLPLLVFREDGVSGGIFDNGVTDAFIHRMPKRSERNEGLAEVFLRWQARVRTHYYGS